MTLLNKSKTTCLFLLYAVFLPFLSYSQVIIPTEAAIHATILTKHDKRPTFYFVDGLVFGTLDPLFLSIDETRASILDFDFFGTCKRDHSFRLANGATIYPGGVILVSDLYEYAFELLQHVGKDQAVIVGHFQFFNGTSKYFVSTLDKKHRIEAGCFDLHIIDPRNSFVDVRGSVSVVKPEHAQALEEPFSSDEV